MPNADELLRDFKEGNERAFEELVGLLWKPVFQLAYRYTGSRPEAEDLCQETFMKVYQHAKTFRGDSKAFTWVYRIASNVCLNWKRKKIPQAAPPDRMVKDNHDFLLKLQLEEVFGKLSGPERILILLSKFYGFSYQEMGKILSITPEKVKSRLHEAKVKLAKELPVYFQKGGTSNGLHDQIQLNGI